MNPILESISNSVSELPTIASMAQPVAGGGLGANAPGGFAFTLAAAKGLAAPTQDGKAQGQTSVQAYGPSSFGGGTLNVGPLAGNASAKKSSAAAPAGSGAIPANSIGQSLVAAALNLANSIPLPLAATGLPLSGVLQEIPTPGISSSTVAASATVAALSSGVVAPGALPSNSTIPVFNGANFFQDLSGSAASGPSSIGSGIPLPSSIISSPTGSVSIGLAANGSVSGETGGSVAPPIPSTDYATPSASGFYSVPAGFSLGGTPAQVAVHGNTTVAANSGGGAGLTKPESALANTIDFAAGEAQPALQSGSQGISAAGEKIDFAPTDSPVAILQTPAIAWNGWAASPAGPGLNTSIPVSASAFASSVLSNAPSLKVADANQDNQPVSLAAESAASALTAAGATQAMETQPAGSDSGLPTAASQSPSTGPANASPILLASAAPVPVPANSFAVTADDRAQSDGSADETGVQPAGPEESASGAEAAGPLAGIIAAQSAAPALPLSVPASPALAAKAAAGPSARSASASVGAPTGLKEASSAPAPSTSPNELSAGPTPFSVFFSDAGSGAQSAASALPHLIAPAVNSALRENHALGTSTSATAAGPQGSGNNSNNVSQNSLAPSLKEPPAASDSAGSGTAQTLHRDADLSAAASAPLTALPTGAAVAAAPASTGITAALGGQAAIPPDSAPKPETLPNPIPDPSANGAQAQPTPAAAAPGAVQMAQMVSRAENSEMRIGMNTSAFGSVEVRTVVHASDVGMTIGSEKGDLRGLLANDLPAITNTLQQQNLRLTGVNFTQGFASSSNSSGGGGDAQQRSFAPMRPIADPILSEAAVEDSPASLNAWQSGGGAGLSILA